MVHFTTERVQLNNELQTTKTVPLSAFNPQAIPVGWWLPQTHEILVWVELASCAHFDV